MIRLTKKDFEDEKHLTRFIQRGEIFGDTIEWTPKMKVELEWLEKVNLDGEPGIQIVDGGWGFAGWDEKRAVYLRYDSSFAQNEHCFRVI